MKPSSNQISPNKDNNSTAQKSSCNEATSENNKTENSTETAGSSSFVQNAGETKSNVMSTKESHFGEDRKEIQEFNLEKEKIEKLVTEEFTSNIRNRQVIMAYEAQKKIRQPFYNRNQSPDSNPPKLPSPPSYYSQGNWRFVPNEATTSRTQNNGFYNPPFQQLGELTIFPDLFINIGHWAPYPSHIPADVPPCLAHLVDAEVLLIIQKIDFIELMLGVSDLNMFFIQNVKNEYVYYAYETTNICGQLCCRGTRNFQIHIVDMYQNEVIYLNKPCGCTKFLCCYPFIEVYAPPMIPVGAVMKIFSFCTEEFNIVDPDENVIFKIVGGNTIKHCCSCFEFTFTIYAQDSQKSVVGYIRRGIGGLFRVAFTDSDLYGISFPKNMDVRLKAVFLGALFLIFLAQNSKKFEEKNGGFRSGDKSYFKKGGEKDVNKIRENDENLKMSIPSNSANVINFLQLIGKLKSLKRTGWVLKNVEDPETVSGHMYRMSIMTFLIPESSGVDKTRCMKLSLVHDLAECIVGDLTPYCGVDTSEKHRQEEVAMKELTQMIGDSGVEIYKLYKEYEAQVTEESKFVKDLDRLDMILQAFEYEKLGEKPGKLEEFFASTINKFHFPWTIDIVKEIYKQRNLHINKDKSLGKDL